jgi:hypothetical protein
MKAPLFLLGLILSTAAYPKDILLGDTKNTHQKERYIWSITQERLEKLPIWKKGDTLPVSPQKAEELAYDWAHRQELAGWIPERPYRICLVTFPPPYEDRYFYKVSFISVEGDAFWTVHILMDGSLVEPKAIQPNQAPEPTAPSGRGSS